MAPRDEEKKHFVLVHGACHGAWCWYKLKPRLESLGHRVTALDLSASGINMKSIEDVRTMADYSRPLLDFMDSLPPNDKVILVGHSQGGFNLALAMDKFPNKVSVAVFLSAFMPDTLHQPSYVLEQYKERMPKDGWLDTQFTPYGSDQNLTSMLFGPKFLSSKLYQLSPIEDLELAKGLLRAGSLFVEDLSKAKKFSDNGYGSVTRVYVLNYEDKGMPMEFQRWMIDISGLRNVMEISGADHMAMLSKPQEVCRTLLGIAHTYT